MKLEAAILDDLTERAAHSERLRLNYNLHESYKDNVQRMFNALEPGTIVPTARHPDASETLIMLRGKLRILIYNDLKEIVEDIIIAPNSQNIGYHIPKGTWHTVESLESGTVCFETREGPYKPVDEDNLLK